MTQLEQLQTIIQKEIKQKQTMQNLESTLPKSQYYYSGALAALRYILFIVEKMNESENGKSE